MRRFLALTLSILLILAMVVGCTAGNEQDAEEPEDNDEVVKDGGRLILSTTTSTENSGLLGHILPVFEEETDITVDVIAVGTGEALQMGKDGDADILLVHAKASEEEFVAEGHGLERHDVMYNDFVLVGPADDPLNLKEDSPDDILKGLKAISEKEADFISRGDDSGTHKRELATWEEADIEPEGEWYYSAGAGMGDVLTMADEKQAYTLTDRGTYLSMKDTLDLEIIIEGDDNLFNQYGIIPVNPEKSDQINAEGAKKLMEWFLSDEIQKMIGEFGVEEFGQPLFVPNAK
ncbi:MAG: solute-binding protein [Tissierellia bacterium]|nr:solute-binding protein [Tissierellia bacterium]